MFEQQQSADWTSINQRYMPEDIEWYQQNDDDDDDVDD